MQTVKGIEKEFPGQEHFITLVSFNGLGRKVMHFSEPVSKLAMINGSRYKPAASTPLYDAMGFSFAKLRDHLEKVSDQSEELYLFLIRSK